MKKSSLLFIIGLLVISCTKKEIKIPVLPFRGLEEIQNQSQVWIFFEEKDNDTIADLNRNNTISSTHWIYNIDKRLQLKHFIEIVKTLQHKHANSLHSEEGMQNLFSYSNSKNNTLSFFAFDETEYITDSVISKVFIKKESNNYLEYNNINLVFNPKSLWINDAKIDSVDFMTTLNEFIDFSSEGKPTLLHLNFNNKLSYNDFLFYRKVVDTLQNNIILINTKEFIFDDKKVPDCNCDS